MSRRQQMRPQPSETKALWRSRRRSHRFDASPTYGNGPSLADTMARTAMAVGPQEVIERVLAYREHAGGDYQRQLFNVDGTGVPRKTVLEQIELVHRSEPLTLADPYHDPVPFEQLLGGR
ncbi:MULTISPECIES: hypothetical protein [unclassified Streptomyces]|uniref:hypothetical protein n=1 Tax=unclassified Streptomyces TaxID=2593676 RepID=UPI0036558D2C